MVGVGAAAVTVMFCCSFPVPPLKLSMAAAYRVAGVVAVTVGAVQLKVQLWVLLGALCTISPLRTFVPVPAAKVPADAATSTPPLPAVPVLPAIGYVWVDPEATGVGPVMVTVGAGPLL